MDTYYLYGLETMPLMTLSMGSLRTQMSKLKWCVNKSLKIRNYKMDTMHSDFHKYYFKNRARVIRKITNLHISLPNLNSRTSKLKSQLEYLT